MRRVSWEERLLQDEHRSTLLLNLTQPLTAHHLARRTDKDRDACSHFLAELARHGLVRCLNPTARRSRVYWLTSHGRACQHTLRTRLGLPALVDDLPDIDWRLYGWVCFAHRSAVLQALDAPRQAAEIKRHAWHHDHTLRMSANNVRDIMRLFVANGIATRVFLRGKAHPRYELTGRGRALQELLRAADARVSAPATRFPITQPETQPREHARRARTPHHRHRDTVGAYPGRHARPATRAGARRDRADATPSPTA